MLPMLGLTTRNWQRLMPQARPEIHSLLLTVLSQRSAELPGPRLPTVFSSVSLPQTVHFILNSISRSEHRPAAFRITWRVIQPAMKYNYRLSFIITNWI